MMYVFLGVSFSLKRCTTLRLCSVMDVVEGKLSWHTSQKNVSGREALSRFLRLRRADSEESTSR
jgi:GTP-dependent phosphoenolpyruvate carboxykinase